MLPVIRNVERIAAGLFYFSALMLFAAGFAVIAGGGAEAALDSLERKDKASATAPFVFAGLGVEELSASGFFDSSRLFVQDWRQYAARDEIKPELQTPRAHCYGRRKNAAGKRLRTDFAADLAGG